MIITPTHKTILSVFPIESHMQARHNGFKIYTHPAAPKDHILIRTFSFKAGLECADHPNDEQTRKAYDLGSCRVCHKDLVPVPPYYDEKIECENGKGYSLLRVYDTVCWVRNFSTDNERYSAENVPASSVADDLVAFVGSFTLGAKSGTQPGIMRINGDHPTIEELETVGQNNLQYFTYLFHDAVAMAAEGRIKDISKLHKVAAMALGRKDLAWLQKIEERSTKLCPNCYNEIDSRALGCQHCHEHLPKWYAEHGIDVDPMKDPAVFDFMQRNKAKAVPPPKPIAPPIAVKAN